jgi:hypothetical protein
MPDWRKAEDYAYLEGVDRHEWAWEFCAAPSIEKPTPKRLQ